MSHRFATNIWKKCKIKDLSDLQARDNSNLLAIDLVQFCGGPSDPILRDCLINYVRITDAVVWQYEAARRTWMNFIDLCCQSPEGLWGGHVVRITMFVECAIVSLHRAIQMGKLLEGQTLNGVVFAFDPIQLDVHAIARIEAFRDSILHWEERIAGDKRHLLDGGIPNGLVLTPKHVAIENHAIQYEELTRWTMHLHALASAAFNTDWLDDRRLHRNNT